MRFEVVDCGTANLWEGVFYFYIVYTGDSAYFKFSQLHIPRSPPSAIKITSSCALGILQHVIDEHIMGLEHHSRTSQFM